METIRDILAAHRSGISKPGLMAWARLRVDPAMTDAQLDEELARLGDEVVDVEGFLYLRSSLDPAQLPARLGGTSGRGARPATADRGGSADGGAEGAGASHRLGWRPPSETTRERRRGGGGLWKLVGVGVFLWWLLGIVGGFLEDGPSLFPEPTPVATASPIALPSSMRAATPSIGDVVPWREIAVGDCIVLPEEDTVGELRRVPCDTRHGGEVFALVDHPGSLENYPDDDFAAFVAERCNPAFQAWTGSAVADQELLRVAWFRPTWEGWVVGDRQVTCYLVQADGTNMYSSYRSSP